MDIEQRTNKGFSLIEMVMTIVLMGIIFSIAGVFIVAPIQNFTSVINRAGLIDAADMSLRRMERDINQALPNSIRVKTSGNVSALEIVNVVEGKRYRNELPGTAADILNFGTTDTTFNVFGQFTDAALGAGSYRVVIYNTGAQVTSSDNPTAGANVYATSTAPGPALPFGSHVISPTTTTVTLSNPGTEGRVTLSSGFQFSLQSPTQRMYIVDTPVTYICDPTAETITRYENYTITDVQPISASATPLDTATSALLTQNLSSCEFTYQPGTSQRSSVVTLDLTLASGGETVRLLQQVGVSNAP